jgi:hypothetical protein
VCEWCYISYTYLKEFLVITSYCPSVCPPIIFTLKRLTDTLKFCPTVNYTHTFVFSYCHFKVGFRKLSVFQIFIDFIFLVTGCVNVRIHSSLTHISERKTIYQSEILLSEYCVLCENMQDCLLGITVFISHARQLFTFWYSVWPVTLWLSINWRTNGM